MPRVSSSSLSSTPCPGLATEHFTVLALVRYVCLTLMTFAVYSFEFGLYHDKFQTMTSASLTASHYMRQSLMISAIIYSLLASWLAGLEFVCASGLSEPPAPWWSTRCCPTPASPRSTTCARP